MLIIAANYMINPFGSLTYAYLIREMRFDSIAVIRFSGTLIGALVSIALAWQGYGPISLAIGMFASTFVSAATSIYFRPRSFPWLPGIAEIGRGAFIRYQTNVKFSDECIGRQCPQVAVGEAAGYGRGRAIFPFKRAGLDVQPTLLTDPIMSVAMSWFATQRREQGGFSESFLKATSYISALGWSFFLTLILLAHPVTRVLYGPQWDASVDLTRILAIGYFFAVPVALCAVALIAAGEATRVLTATTVSTVSTVILAAIGAQFGQNMLAWAMTLSALASALVWIHMVKRAVNFFWQDLFGVLFRSALVAVFLALGPMATFLVFGPPHRIVLSFLSLVRLAAR